MKIDLQLIIFKSCMFFNEVLKIKIIREYCLESIRIYGINQPVEIFLEKIMKILLLFFRYIPTRVELRVELIKGKNRRALKSVQFLCVISINFAANENRYHFSPS